MAGFRLTSSGHNVNLWIVPLKMSLAAIVLFGITITPDMLAAYHVIHIPDWFTMGGIDDARAILSAMLGCVSTVLALIFSVALLVLSMVANLFGPRLLYRFVQDWVTQVCIGLFMGSFIYVFLVFLVTHKDEHTSFIPQVSLITSWFLVLAAFGFLVFYSHRVAVLIQNPDAIGRIVDDLRRAVKLAAPYSTSEPHLQQLDAFATHQTMSDSAAMLSPKSGYLQEIHHRTLVSAAAKAGAADLRPLQAWTIRAAGRDSRFDLARIEAGIFGSSGFAQRHDGTSPRPIPGLGVRRRSDRRDCDSCP
jgi:uncharacterized membrane protein